MISIFILLLTSRSCESWWQHPKKCFNTSDLFRHTFMSNNLAAERKLEHYVMSYEVVIGRKSAELFAAGKKEGVVLEEKED